MMRKTELSPAKRLRCPRCETRIATTGTSDGSNALKHPVGCLKCGHIESNAVVSDPLESAVGWLSGEVGRQAVTYEIKEGRLVPMTNTK
jgi:hypothetical protein